MNPTDAIVCDVAYTKNRQALAEAGLSERDIEIVLSNVFLRYMDTNVLEDMPLVHPCLIWDYLRLEAQKANFPNEALLTNFAAKIIAYAYLPNFRFDTNPLEASTSSKVNMFVALSKLKRGALSLTKAPENTNIYTFK